MCIVNWAVEMIGRHMHLSMMDCGLSMRAITWASKWAFQRTYLERYRECVSFHPCDIMDHSSIIVLTCSP